MKRILFWIVLILVVAIAAYMGWMYIDQPEMGDLPPVPPPN